MRSPLASLALALAMLLWPADAPRAGEVQVVGVEAYALGGGEWRFDVTLRHGDTGWEHYANKWEVVGPDGTVLGTRVLAHPHVNEQPFTRSLLGVRIPESVGTVTVRAYDSVHGLAQNGQVIELPR